MARPKKNTVDYFPHDCHWSKELEIFINKHGNKGYAFYFRLLELLGVTPDHKYDYSKPIDYQYLVSKTEVDEKKLEVYIEYLVSIGVIDEELWKEKKIWVQSFVDSVAEVYEKRITQLPTKEGFRPENSTSAGFPTRKQGFSPENGGFLYGNSQSKGKETKVKESVVEDAHTPHTDIPPWVDEIGTQYPRIDVNHVYMRYKHNRDGKGKLVDKEGFLLWVMEDDRKGRNLKKKEKPTHTTLYCVQGDWSMQVPADKTYGHTCEECGDQMVGKHELAAFRNPITKKIG